MAGCIEDWRARQQHPASLILYAIGIPMIPVAGILAFVQLGQNDWPLWWRPVGLLILSYLLQWIGHEIEGNDMGEWIVIKRVLGKPCTTVSPRFAPRRRIESKARTVNQETS